MEGRSRISRTRSTKASFAEFVQWLCVALFLGAALPQVALAQGNENFTNIPTGTPTNYLTRSWTGTNGVVWTATSARTDQTLTGKAICTNNTATVTSPLYTGGMGTLSFNYVRGFTGTGERTFEVWVNGVQIGGTTTISGTSDVVVAYSALINVAGNVSVQIRTAGNQIKIDDIQWNSFAGGPTVNFALPTSSALENVGVAQTITMSISPVPTVAGTITIAIGGSSTASYGTDHTTTPVAAGGTTITLPVAIGDAAKTFDVNIIDDLFNEGNETILFTITGTTGGVYTGSNLNHTFTILDDDVTTTVEFSTLSISALETAGPQMFSMSISGTTPNPSGALTIQITNGPGATYGATPSGDYITNPNGSTLTFNVPFSPTATSVNFTVDPQLDGIPESTETVTFTILSVPAGWVIGPNNSATFHIGDVDSPPALFAPGDLAVVGVNAKNTGCGDPNMDQVSFFCFKEITYGTEIILTDNGYERCNPGKWGNSEGTVMMRRTGPAIPAGQVVTFQIYNGVPNVIALAPDAQWTYTLLNAPSGAPPAYVSLNNGGDQLFFLQGGTWNSGTATAGIGHHNATYDGTILYAFTTQPTNPWVPACTGNSSDNQRSGRPPGVECFSMAPTLVSDHNKYKGPITAATQRDWINRIDDTANWTSYNNCGEYNTLDYNWFSAPTLPILAGTMTNGRWRGSKDTDWFNCKNWDDARIPIATTDVVIDQSAARNCVVGIEPASNATCASLTQSSTGVSRQLTIRNNSTLQVNGPLLVKRSVAGLALITTVVANSTLLASSVELEGATPGNFEAVLECKGAGSRVLVEGGLTIGYGALLDLQLLTGTSGRLELGGDFINLNDQTSFLENFSTVRLVGNGDQIISVSIGAEVFGTLEVVKTGGDVLLASPLYIRSVLNLSNGRIQNNASSLLTLMSGSSVINASDDSFVTGPVEKVGNASFIFPVGKGTVLRPCSLSNITGSSSNAFTAEYFLGNPRVLFGEAVEPTLDHVSACEHWMIDRSVGTANATVSLSWREPISCGVTELSSLRVARWDNSGSIWRDRGNGGETGTLSGGYVPTAAVQTVFGPWTLASISNENPLPITLLSFDAQAAGSVVDLYWATASEMNNEHFTVERSADGNTFLPLLRVPGAGNSTVTLEYGAVDDAPLQGLSYYRLRQTDFDGTSTLSNVVSVRMNQLSSEPLSVHVGDGTLRAFHSFEAGSSYSILDMTARLVSKGVAEEDEVLDIPVVSLPSGAYVLRMQDGQRSESVRFIR